MIEKANMQEGKSKYGGYAKMYVEMLFRLLSLPFIFQTLRKFDQQTFRKSLTKNASQKESVGQGYLETDFKEIEGWGRQMTEVFRSIGSDPEKGLSYICKCKN